MMAVETESTDKARLEELYRLYGKQVARWATRLGGPRADASDVVQEVFLVIASKFKEFRGEAKVSTWLFRITQNVVCNRRKSERSWGWLKASADPVARGLPTSAADPSEPMELSDAKARVHKALDGLGEAERNALILFEIEGLSGEEIAELTGVRTEAVWMRLTRARRQLIRRLARMES